MTVAPGGVSVGRGLSFSANGYTVGGGAISLTGTTASINNLFVGTGLSATVNSNLAATSGLSKSGAGTLVVGGTISGGTVFVNNGTLTVAPAAAISSSGISVLSTGTLDVTQKVGGYTVPGGQSLAGAGVVSGTVTMSSGATLSPGSNLGTLTVTGGLTLNGGGNYNWQIVSGSGSAGTSWDLASVGGTLSIASTSATPFKINLWSLSGTSPDVNGNAANFNSAQNYTWTIATAAGGISGFSANKFIDQHVGHERHRRASSNSVRCRHVQRRPGGQRPQPRVHRRHALGDHDQRRQRHADAEPGGLSAALGLDAGPEDGRRYGRDERGQHRSPARRPSSRARCNWPTPRPWRSSRLTPLAGGTVTLAPYLQTAVGGLNPNAGGLVNVGNGMIVVASGLTVPNMLTAITAGYNGGTWTGTTGITSSTAAVDTAGGAPRAIGWLDNGDGSVTFAFAAPGDTNLDGLVDVLDAAALSSAARFNDTAVWSEGDFNYDGIYDDLDNALFVSTGLFDAGPYNAPPGAAGAIAPVPEPSTWAMIAALPAACCSRACGAGGGPDSRPVFAGTRSVASGPLGRGCPCPVAGRSLRASCPSLSRCCPRFAILASLGQQRRRRGTGNPSPDNAMGSIACCVQGRRRDRCEEGERRAILPPRDNSYRPAAGFRENGVRSELVAGPGLLGTATISRFGSDGESSRGVARRRSPQDPG